MGYDFYTELDNQRIKKDNVPNHFVRLKLLKLEKNRKVKEKYKNMIKFINLSEEYDLIKSLGISEIKRINADLNHSYLFKIDFKLKKSYISKDDEEFYIIDNPICKDKVFKTPLVRPSSWKGALRYSAMRNVLGKEGLEKVNARIIMLRLFGNEKKKMTNFLDKEFGKLNSGYKKKVEGIYHDKNPNLRGRLVFYPTFFDEVNLDVITPHDRKTKTPSRGPIYFETVPLKKRGKNCIFNLLYFPFDLIGKKNTNNEINSDLTFLIDSISDMFIKHGFGAKTTSGYGIVKDEIKFKVNDNSEKEGTFEDFKEYIKNYTGAN
ncbi:MAG: RAMP superfamily protein [Methanobacterium sp. PtaU1.Bin097]|jgi:CRISPR-associated protein Cmr2|nr:MAG: RAMP superfamily protein [Methanobacterium sp. PtaU1.Bin097]